MKKIFALLAALAFTLALPLGANAAGNAHGHHGNCASATACRFVDANGDGICDNHANCVFADADCDGLCDVCGHGGAHCGYQDQTQTGSGISGNRQHGRCPRFNETCLQPQSGAGRHHGGNHHGRYL